MSLLLARLRRATNLVALSLALVSALSILFQLGYIFFAAPNGEYELEVAEQDARVCEYTEHCDEAQAWQDVEALRQENREARAVHWFRAGVCGLALLGSSVLLIPDIVLRLREPAPEAPQATRGRCCNRPNAECANLEQIRRLGIEVDSEQSAVVFDCPVCGQSGHGAGVCPFAPEEAREPGRSS